MARDSNSAVNIKNFYCKKNRPKEFTRSSFTLAQSRSVDLWDAPNF